MNKRWIIGGLAVAFVGWILLRPRTARAAAPSFLVLRSVARGDTLFVIAEREYGDGFLWPVILDANRALLTDGPDALTAGLQLVIPDIATFSSAYLDDARMRAREHREIWLAWGRRTGRPAMPESVLFPSAGQS